MACAYPSSASSDSDDDDQEVRETLRRLLPKKPSTGYSCTCKYGYVAVPMAVYRSWQETVRTSTDPLPLEWPDQLTPLKWVCDVSKTDVVFLKPRVARGVTRVVGGGGLLTKQEFKGWDALMGGDDEPRFVASYVIDKRGGAWKDLGGYLLPVGSTLYDALTAVLGTTPNAVEDDDTILDLDVTCLAWKRDGGYNLFIDE